MSNKFANLNTEFIFEDIKNVLDNGINQLLTEFKDNYVMYEETHNAINMDDIAEQVNAIS